MQRQSWTSDSGGFTLVELAIVLVVVGILLGVGSSMVGVLSNAVKVRQAKDSLDENSQAVASWASANNRLPRLIDFTSNTPVAKTQMDPWSRPFVFLYYSSLAPLAANATKDTICGRRSTPLTVTTSNPTTTVANVAYVLLTGGDTGGDTLNSTIGGTPISRLSSSNTAVGGDTIGNVLIDPTNTDVARWVTLDELRSKVGCQGAPLKIVNNELPFTTVGAAGYSASITPDGGVSPAGTYRWCVEIRAATTALPTGLSFTSSPIRELPLTCNSLAEASWGGPSATLPMTGTPTAGTQGSYAFTVYVRDSDNNVTSKPFVLTVNPQ